MLSITQAEPPRTKAKLAKQKNPKAASSPAEPTAATIGHNSDQEKKDMLVSSFLRFKKEEGASYVKRCQIVVEAEDELPKDIFKAFCEEVGLPRNSSMFRKARTVAQAATRLLAIAERLPDSKSTIYELAKIDEPVFQELFESGKRITAAAVKAALPVERKQEPRQERFVVAVDATALSHGERLELIRVLDQAAKEAGAEIKLPKSLVEAEARA